MNWWGKLIAGTFGFMLGGPLGAVLGIVLGHQFDKGMARFTVERSEDQARVQLAFFTATFSVMGKVAKVDGRVCEDEIGFARAVMDRMALSEAQRRVAIGLFTQGKSPEFDLDAALAQFRRECHGRMHLLRVFLEIQLQAAYADGQLDAAERRLLLHIGESLGFSAHEFEHLEALVRFAREFAGTEAPPRQAPPRDRLGDAYRILDLRPEASPDEIKRAYRRLMNQHHPDKLVAKGLPEEMVRLATEKTQEIKTAYETIKAARGMR
ncbi:MAG: co-chaperone DjlA [Thiohalomonadaceae bacterium]